MDISKLNYTCTDSGVRASSQRSRFRGLFSILSTLMLTLMIFAAQPLAALEDPPEFIMAWGSYGSGDGQFNYATGVVIGQNGWVYVSDAENHRIQVFDSNGNLLFKWGSYGSGDGQFNSPDGFAFDAADGSMYVTEYHGHRVQKFDANGNFILKFGTFGSGDGQFKQPTGGAVDADGNVYIADRVNHRIQKFDSQGNFIMKWGSWGTGGPDKFYYPTGIAFDSAGDLYVAGHYTHKVHKYDTEGNFITEWSAPGDHAPYGIAIDSLDNVYTAALHTAKVYKQTTDGTLLTSWGSYGSSDGQFHRPAGVTIGDDGYIYIADQNNHRVQKFGIPVLEIVIDIKPGDTNCVNINSHGTIPVALLGAEDFDVTQVDQTSLLFAGLEVRVKGKKGPQCAVEYSNDDAYPDLVCQFVDDADSFVSENGEATLSGTLFDGTSIEGSDSICLDP